MVLLLFSILFLGCSSKVNPIKENKKVSSYYQCTTDNMIVTLMLRFHKTTTPTKEKVLLRDALKKHDHTLKLEDCDNYKRVLSRKVSLKKNSPT